MAHAARVAAAAGAVGRVLGRPAVAGRARRRRRFEGFRGLRAAVQAQSGLGNDHVAPLNPLKSQRNHAKTMLKP